ncbi:MAG: hypothetical protein ACYSU1_00500 [Planctomycetota bacterium]|jgi:hypothetical protein
MFLSFGILLDVLLFVLGSVWMQYLWPDLPKHWEDLRSTNPKVEKWPIVAVLSCSALLLLWMLGFLVGYLKLAFSF